MLAFALGAVWVDPARAETEVPGDVARSFLPGLPLAETVKEALGAKVEEHRTESQWTALVEGTVYCLATVPIEDDRDAGMRRTLEQAAVKRAIGRATNMLFLQAAGSRLSSETYRDRDVLADALAAYEGSMEVGGRLSPGIQRQGDAVGKQAVAIAYVSADKMDLYRAVLPSEERLRPLYSRFLFAKAQSLVADREFNGALPLLKEVHMLGWDHPEVYLETASCFLKLGKTDDAVRMLKGVVDRFDPVLTAAQAEAAGNLMLEAGMHAEAQGAFEAALRRLREENAGISEDEEST